MDDYITVKRQFVLDAINIGLSGYVSDDDKLTLEGMGITVSEMPTTDLSGFCDRLWKSAYDRGYERCKDDAVEAIEMLLEQSEDDEHDKTWNDARRGAINAVKHHVPSVKSVNASQGINQDKVLVDEYVGIEQEALDFFRKIANTTKEIWDE